MDNDARARFSDFEYRIDKLESTYYEILASLKYIIENQRNFSVLIEAKAEHTVELQHIARNMEHTNDELAKIETRLARLEISNEIKKEEEKEKLSKRGNFGMRDSFFEMLRDYGHIITVVSSAILILLSYFLGIKLTPDK